MKAGVASKGYLSRVIRGQRPATKDLLLVIADALAVDFAWLATGRWKIVPNRTPPPISVSEKHAKALEIVGEAEKRVGELSTSRDENVTNGNGSAESGEDTSRTSPRRETTHRVRHKAK